MASRLTLTLAALGLAALLQPAAGGSAARGCRAVHQPGLLLLPAGRCAAGGISPPADIIALSLRSITGIISAGRTRLPMWPSRRQKAYAHGRSDRQVFTPQMIVNGKKSCIGSDRAQIEKAIRYTSKGRKTLPVAVNLSEQNGTVTIAVEETPGPRSAMRRSGSCPSCRRRRCRSGAARTAARPSPTPMWCAA